MQLLGRMIQEMNTSNFVTHNMDYCSSHMSSAFALYVEKI